MRVSQVSVGARRRLALDQCDPQAPAAERQRGGRTDQPGADDDHLIAFAAHPRAPNIMRLATKRFSGGKASSASRPRPRA